MNKTKVIRRFELHVSRGEVLSQVAKSLEAAVNAQPPGSVRAEIRRFERPPLVVVRLEGGPLAVSDVVTRIAAVGDDVRVRQDRIRIARTGKNGLVYPDLAPQLRIRADALPKHEGTAKPVTVAIVDSGIMAGHPDLKKHLWKGAGDVPGVAFVDGARDDLRDQDGHGTMLAGTVIAAAGDAPVELAALKFFDAAHPPRPDNAAAALGFAVGDVVKAQVVLLSWDVGLGSPSLEAAFAKACARALVVIAAGNAGTDNDWHDGRTLARAPARYAREYPKTTIVVMATDEYDQKAWFSNYGRASVDLAAPGSDIVTTRRAVTSAAEGAPAYRTFTGTSAAAAHVAGAAALIMSRYPKLLPAAVKDCLVETVDRIAGLKCIGGGRLNVAAALRRAAVEAKKL